MNQKMLNQSSSKEFFKKFILCTLLCLGGGWLTGWVTESGVKTWYPHLVKPYGTPPDIVFPIVWTILYLCMALSLTLLWVSDTAKKISALFFFGLQLVLNFTWSWLFFYLQKPGLALVDVVALWLAIVATIYYMWGHTKLGSVLLIPYLVWVTYAAYLNLAIWVIN